MLPTLAERMQDAGYHTAAIGHQPVLEAESGLPRGFQEFNFQRRWSGINPLTFCARIVERVSPDMAWVWQTSTCGESSVLTWPWGGVATRKSFET